MDFYSWSQPAMNRNRDIPVRVEPDLKSSASCLDGVSEHAALGQGLRWTDVQEAEACHVHNNTYNLGTAFFGSQWRSCELAQW